MRKKFQETDRTITSDLPTTPAVPLANDMGPFPGGLLQNVNVLLGIIPKRKKSPGRQHLPN
jgi:hypothetical protein